MILDSPSKSVVLLHPISLLLRLPVIEVARELFGQEARKRSTVREKHFPDNSGLFVNVQKNKWFSPGDKRGGDVVSLVQFATGCDFKGTLS
jgi:hypothetical protein